MNLGDHLEPIAAAMGNATPDVSSADVATVSIAVSLKRIADRLDHMTNYFDAEKAQLRVGANCDVRQVG